MKEVTSEPIPSFTSCGTSSSPSKQKSHELWLSILRRVPTSTVCSVVTEARFAT